MVIKIGDLERSELIQQAGPMLSSVEAATLLGRTRQNIDEMVTQELILGVRFGIGWRFPLIQFRQHDVLPGLAIVLASMGNIDPWRKLQILMSPTEPNGRRTFDLLLNGEKDRVLAIASRAAAELRQSLGLPLSRTTFCEPMEADLEADLRRDLEVDAVKPFANPFSSGDGRRRETGKRLGSQPPDKNRNTAEPQTRERNLGHPAGIPLTIRISGAQTVSALLVMPPAPSVCYVMAHGAGAGMTHPFMSAFAHGLAGRRIATLRYQFPFVENGSKRPDSPALAHATIRAAVAEAAQQLPSVPLIAGGKSFGGRMTSQAQAEDALPSVAGLAFVGFPLHPAGKPSTERAAHLAGIRIPILFLQGTRDALADLVLVNAAAAVLGGKATLKVIEGADHSFHVLARSGRTDAQVMTELLDAFAEWIGAIT